MEEKKKEVPLNCEECGHEWKEIIPEATEKAVTHYVTCPHCGKKIKLTLK